MTLFFFVTLSVKSADLNEILDTAFFSARMVLLSLDAEPFTNADDKSKFICFTIGFIIRVFIFSIIFAAIREVYEEEFIEYDNYTKEFKTQILGDFIFFLLNFVLKNFYNIYEYLQLRKEHKKIIEILHKFIPDAEFENISELDEHETNDLCEVLEKSSAQLMDMFYIYKFSLNKNRRLYLIKLK